jgi:hypothetical protein
VIFCCCCFDLVFWVFFCSTQGFTLVRQALLLPEPHLQPHSDLLKMQVRFHHFLPSYLPLASNTLRRNPDSSHYGLLGPAYLLWPECLCELISSFFPCQSLPQSISPFQLFLVGQVCFYLWGFVLNILSIYDTLLWISFFLICSFT